MQAQQVRGQSTGAAGEGAGRRWQGHDEVSKGVWGQGLIISAAGSVVTEEDVDLPITPFALVRT